MVWEPSITLALAGLFYTVYSEKTFIKIPRLATQLIRYKGDIYFNYQMIFRFSVFCLLDYNSTLLANTPVGSE